MTNLALVIHEGITGALFGAGASGDTITTHTAPPTSPENRLEDLRVLGSQYGAPIPFAVGTVRLAGQMIWAMPIVEESVTYGGSTTVSTGGKYGKEGETVTTATSDAEAGFDYFANFAVAFCQGKVLRLLRIWADGTLILDTTGEQEVTHKLDLNYRAYWGDEEQLPDPLIEASVDGGQAPAHRGIAYIVFERLPLKQFGNRIPSITAEGSFAENDMMPYKEGAWIGDETSHSTTSGALNYTTQKLYLAQGGRSLSTVDTTTMTETRRVDLTSGVDGFTLTGFIPLTVNRDGYVFGVNNVPQNNKQICKVDPITGRVLAVHGTPSSSAPNITSTLVSSPRKMTTQVVIKSDGTTQEYLCIVDAYDSIGIYSADDLSHVFHKRGEYYGAFARTQALAPGGIFQGYSHVYWTAYSTTSAASFLYRETISETGAVTHERLLRFGYDEEAADIIEGATEDGSLRHLNYDAANDSLIFVANVDGTTYWIRWDERIGYHGAVASPVAVSEVDNLDQRIVRDEVLVGFSPMTKINIITGEITYEKTWPTEAYSTGSSQRKWYDGETDSLLTLGGGAQKAYFGRQGREGTGLADTVAAFLQRGGMAEAQYDVSELVGTVPGYVIADPSITIRGALESLATAYGFSAVESDDKIRFRHTDRTAPDRVLVAGPDQSDLLWLDEDSGVVLEEVRGQEVGLPQGLSLTYFNPERGYTIGEVHAQRPLSPAPATESLEWTQIQVPIALYPDQAMSAVWRILRERWLRRTTYRLSTLWTHIDLDPLDIIEVRMAGGGSYLMMLSNVLLEKDMKVVMEGWPVAPPSFQSAPPDGADVPTYEDAPPDEYDPPLEGDGGSGTLPEDDNPDTTNAPPTRLITLDAPLLQDGDALASQSRIYLAGTPLSEDRPWRNALAGYTRDGTEWIIETTLTEPAAVGTTTNALGAPADPYATDEANTLTVVMSAGASALASVSQAAMLNGANRAAVVLASGPCEIIQFRDVAENPDGSFTLSGLLRGRRGTEVFCADHEASETFVLLNGAVERGDISFDDVGVKIEWGAMSEGQSAPTFNSRAVAFNGRDKMPYAPAHLAAAFDGGDLSVTWARRTRLNGALRDGTETVPVSEWQEAYEIDVLDGPGGAVLDTFTHTGAPPFTLTAAQIGTLGLTGAAITVQVAQMNEHVGRGYAAETTATP